MAVDAPIVDDAQLARWFPTEPPSEVQERRDAAEAYIRRVCRVPEGGAPADLVQAVHLMVARYLARRNSPDGTLGMSEFGVGRISAVDRDIEQLLGPHRRVVFG